MLEKCRNAQERWGGVHQIIDRWLGERRELIVHMFAINGGPEGSQADDTPLEVRVQQFCEILVDYVSAGHFEVYEQLLREAEEFKDADMETVSRIVAALDANTEHVLAFNDAYRDVTEARQHLDQLEGDLSNLGEKLEERFELEDRMIRDLHEVHRDKVIAGD